MQQQPLKGEGERGKSDLFECVVSQSAAATAQGGSEAPTPGFNSTGEDPVPRCSILFQNTVGHFGGNFIGITLKKKYK